MDRSSAIPPPPRPGLARRLWFIWSSRDALPRLPRWLLGSAAPVIAGATVLYVANGFLAGWRTAYEALLGITSPAEAEPQWCAWPLSLTGWALLPALIGGVVGYGVSGQIEAHRSQTLDAILAEIRGDTGRSGQDGGS
ncbi:DUF6313 family protein [Streptomyces specialis]|uniref:DUF6313 family protein n=1 Tax=Streptomyces specialis TaxID=498367 RepID=UPI00073F26DF|nr:DUF6313 family protein [Streptomyces specialis]